MERERQEKETESEKQMKKGQEGRWPHTDAALLVLVEVVTRTAVARVRSTNADALVLTAVSPVRTRINDCREQDTVTLLSQPPWGS